MHAAVRDLYVFLSNILEAPIDENYARYLNELLNKLEHLGQLNADEILAAGGVFPIVNDTKLKVTYLRYQRGASISLLGDPLSFTFVGLYEDTGLFLPSGEKDP